MPTILFDDNEFEPGFENAKIKFVTKEDESKKKTSTKLLNDLKGEIFGNNEDIKEDIHDDEDDE
ncbi:UNVERIFIED_CONTAM: hypothetical protein O8I53_07865 [Campylobacter lari]